ncbi:MAG: ADP-ribosylglycohydrolase family protein [Saprospiraceae bacterium]|nr:ADP-ribosylglycohydrolase family protein [Saprospiraceae bacterium]
MINRIILSSLVFCSLLAFTPACKEEEDGRRSSFPAPKDLNEPAEISSWDSSLTREIYHDKVLGMIIGSAIGDAMGAPTEMWHRDAIATQLGYVAQPEAVIREGSPEGPWAYNLPAGGTTDDTRWKYLITEFINGQNLMALKTRDFAQFIIDLYLDEKSEVNKKESFGPDEVETEIRQMTWLQEWAKVAKPYIDNDLDGFREAANRFYGGEMACAGMLYAPSIGAYYPGQPEKAYQESFNLSLFDLGYARDITGLTAAYVAKAMQPGIDLQDIGALTRTIDPEHYFESRLVGRIANGFYQDARQITFDAKGLTDLDVNEKEYRIPKNYPYSKLYYAQVQKAYELLDDKLQDIPFHAGEIHLINLTAIEFCEGDFKKTIEFVVNYGRDNDTVAAVTGAILGAYTGAKNLPDDWKKIVEKTNKEIIGIDLEKIADQITAKAFGK